MVEGAEVLQFNLLLCTRDKTPTPRLVMRLLHEASVTHTSVFLSIENDLSLLQKELSFLLPQKPLEHSACLGQNMPKQA